MPDRRGRYPGSRFILGEKAVEGAKIKKEVMNENS